MACEILPFPQELRPRLPTIVGNVDYRTLRRRLEDMDALLTAGGVEKDFVERALKRWSSARKSAHAPSAREQERFQQRSRRALRCTVLRTLLQEDYRGFSCQLAGNPLYQWFCTVDALEAVRVPSKSELQRFASWLPAQEMREVMDGLLKQAIQQPRALGLKQSLDLEEYFLDSSCLKAPVHFPTDWVLLRDAVRTLTKALILIRKQGLRARMATPERFQRQMNRLCIEMSAQGRRVGGRRARKRVLRAMKRLVGVVRGHARRHRQLLDQQWARTEWTRRQAEQVLGRLDRMLELLPKAQKQAHERIIGERPVDNAEKILSLYDPDVRVIVRGKAGAEVEFGNTVLVGENSQGIILDYALYRQSAPADSQLLFESLLRVKTLAGREVGAVVTDRGFASKANSAALAESITYDATCPRRPQMLARKMKSAKFARLQRRRAQTEARIGILKNGFLGRPARAQGYPHRELALAWAVLTHNLWMLARQRQATAARKKPKPPAPLARAA